MVHSLYIFPIRQFEVNVLVIAPKSIAVNGSLGVKWMVSKVDAFDPGTGIALGVCKGLANFGSAAHRWLKDQFWVPTLQRVIWEHGKEW